MKLYITYETSLTVNYFNKQVWTAQYGDLIGGGVNNFLKSVKLKGI